MPTVSVTTSVSQQYHEAGFLLGLWSYPCFLKWLSVLLCRYWWRIPFGILPILGLFVTINTDTRHSPYSYQIIVPYAHHTLAYSFLILLAGGVSDTSEGEFSDDELLAALREKRAQLLTKLQWVTYTGVPSRVYNYSSLRFIYPG